MLTQIAEFYFICYNLIMTAQAIEKKIIPILKRQGVTKAAIFGWKKITFAIYE